MFFVPFSCRYNNIMLCIKREDYCMPVEKCNIADIHGLGGRLVSCRVSMFYLIHLFLELCLLSATHPVSIQCFSGVVLVLLSL